MERGQSTMLDQETIRLLDDVDPGDVIQVVYFDELDRERMRIGKYSRLEVDEIGEWVLFQRNRWVGIRVIDIIRIERV